MVAAELIAYVREVSEELVADFQAGAQKSRDWSDERTGRALVGAAFDKCLASLAATGLSGRATQVPSGELWKVAGSWLQHGHLQVRARSKPRGYAGDDVMLTEIFQRTVCEHPLGRLFDEYFQALDAPEAVRGRMRLAGAAIVEAAGASPHPDFRIVSVGSGPAIEVQLAIEAWPAERVQPPDVTLLDLDQEALDRARVRLTEQLPAERIHALRENLYRLPRQTEKAQPLAEADFLVCLGLFDYLDKPDAVAMLRTFWESLRPGGTLLVGNFSPDCKARAYMEWIGNWYLIYRTRKEFAALALAAGIPAEQTRIDAEPTGVDLLLIATRPAE